MEKAQVKVVLSSERSGLWMEEVEVLPYWNHQRIIGRVQKIALAPFHHFFILIFVISFGIEHLLSVFTIGEYLFGLKSSPLSAVFIPFILIQRRVQAVGYLSLCFSPKHNISFSILYIDIRTFNLKIFTYIQLKKFNTFNLINKSANKSDIWWSDFIFEQIQIFPIHSKYCENNLSWNKLYKSIYCQRQIFFFLWHTKISY